MRPRRERERCEVVLRAQIQGPELLLLAQCHRAACSGHMDSQCLPMQQPEAAPNRTQGVLSFWKHLHFPI